MRRLLIRRVDASIVYSDEEIDLTGLVDIILEVDSGVLKITPMNDGIAIRSDLYLHIDPRAANTVHVRLI